MSAKMTARATKIWNEIPRDLGADRWIDYIATELTLVAQEANDREYWKGYGDGQEDPEHGYDAGFSAGAREMREMAANVCAEDRNASSAVCMYKIRSLPLPATEGLSPTAKPSTAKGEK